MKILSKYKDYYDHVGLIYGVDPKITFLRTTIKMPQFSTVDTVESDSFLLDCDHYPTLSCEGKYQLFNTPQFDHYLYKWLIVCGKGYLLVQRSKKHPQYSCKDVKHWSVFDCVTHANLYNSFCRTRNHYVLQMYNAGNYSKHKEVKKIEQQMQETFAKYVGCEFPFFLQLTIVLQQPIFIINDVRRHTDKNYTVSICNNVPQLSNCGFASIIEPYTLFQNISHYLTDVIQESADIKPPVIVGDKDLLIGKGFDYRYSFRHRKNEDNNV